MAKRGAIEKSVKKILTEHEEARGNDDILYILVCDDFYAGIKSLNFGYVMAYREKLNIPSYKSVERARRKLQEKHEELKPCKELVEIRADLEEEHRLYYGGAL